MPTRRTGLWLALTVLVYFLGNQTQVGWLYLMASGILGLLVVHFFYTWGMLRRLDIERTFASPTAEPAAQRTASPYDLADTAPTFHEDDPIQITLRTRKAGLRPAFLIHGEETCPFAPTDEQKQTFFIPSIYPGQRLNLTYTTTCDRRGWHCFEAVRVRSSGPFGMFTTRRRIAAPTDMLVYPQYYPLERLRLLESRGFSEQLTQHAGQSSEVIGTREYRPGDSMRQIHWRSTARTGRLVVKEFADTDQMTMTVVLDLQAGSSLGAGKFSTFETAVRLAASFGYYAQEKKLPFHLAGSSRRWSPPTMPLGWWGILNYLTKVEQDGQEPLPRVLSRLTATSFVVVLVSRPTDEINRTLMALPQRGISVLAIFITPPGEVAPPVQAVPRLETLTVTPEGWREFLQGV